MSQPTPENVEPVVNDDLAAMDIVPTTLGDPTGPSKGRVTVVHLYPREMSIYGDLGNTRCLEARLRWHGYEPNVISHNPGDDFPDDVHLVVGGGGQDSGQVRVEADLEKIGPKLKELAEDGVPMLMICGMYQLFGKAFITVDGKTLPGLGILDVTTRGNEKRMIGPVVLSTEFGDVVGYENHSGSTVLGEGQEAFGSVRSGFGNNGEDGHEGARTNNVVGSYLHGPILPANPHLADWLIARAVEKALAQPFEPGEIDDRFADQARERQVRRLTKS
ncbi:type 1 glutamine amidotransferase [Dermacoccus sp. PAMC28757]|uniref:type 1 glutamine amidotransferase n=1 Tax=Dermacoccus sp. PAMC28757 TaxID=2762331 RepID=UPI00351C1F4A